MTESGALFHVGITSVLCRCAGAGLMALWAPLAGAAGLDDISSIDAALSLIERFESVCGPQVERGALADKSGLVALNADQIASMSAALGYRGPAAIWSDADATWYQVQHAMEKPETCEFVSFRITLEDMLAAWDDHVRDGERWQAFSDAKAETASSGGDGSGHFAFRSHESQVIVAGVTGVRLVENGYVLLRAQKTKVRAGGGQPGEDR